jgi:hypothetical protein
MPKPRLLLDVDGVLCPFEGCEGYHRYDLVSTNPDEDAHAAWRSILDGWVWISDSNRERLQRLQRTFALTWATAWEDHANDCLLVPHGLEDPLEVIRFDYSWVDRDEIKGVQQKLNSLSLDPGVYSWKLPWIRVWAERDGGPLAWVDDDIGPDTLAWADERSESGVPTLVIKTDPLVGLTDDHVDQLEEWWRDASETDGDGAGTGLLQMRERNQARTDRSEEAK